jgi:tripartite-type tricarboxylate transporter receptor subunit TctC
MDGVTNEKDRQLLKLAVAWDEMAWPFALPPQVPADRVALLRKAFAAVLNDPELRVQAQKEGLDLSLVEPQQIEHILADVYATPADVVETMKDIMKGK